MVRKGACNISSVMLAPLLSCLKAVFHYKPCVGVGGVKGVRRAYVPVCGHCWGVCYGHTPAERDAHTRHVWPARRAWVRGGSAVFTPDFAIHRIFPINRFFYEGI